MLRSELVVKEIVELELPERCQCDFPNLNIHGTRIFGSLKIEIRCMRCGKPLVKLEQDERL